MSEPIAVRVTRYRCPHCPRSASSKGRSREHIARCWHNPEARGCKTCKHFRVDTYEGETCWVGVDLSGRPECDECKGGGITFSENLGASECGACGGDGAPVKAGPIVHCDQWEPEQ